MDLQTYLLNALKVGETYRETEWIISAFATTEYVEHKRSDAYPYRIIKGADQTYYVDPNDLETLIPLDGVKGNGPLFHHKDKITITPEMVVNAQGPTETDIGKLLANYILLIYPFGSRIPYMNEQISGKKLADFFAKTIEDDPYEDGQFVEPEEGTNRIFIKDFLKYYEAYVYFWNFTQLFVPGDTERSLQTHPDMEKRKKELFEQYKDQLHDPVILTKIEEELMKLDREWLAGDSSLGLWVKDKDHKVVRKKLFMTVGNVTGFSDSNEANPIENSLDEGWDLSKFSDYNDDLRVGSYDRGRQTALGGEFVKWLIRISSNIKITQDDCGTTLGRRVVLTEQNIGKYIGFDYVTRSGKPAVLTEELARKFIGRRIIIRSPAYCTLSHNEYCSTCVGPNLREHKAGVSTALTKMGDMLMYIFMQSMHGKIMAVEEYNMGDWLHWLPLLYGLTPTRHFRDLLLINFRAK